MTKDYSNVRSSSDRIVNHLAADDDQDESTRLGGTEDGVILTSTTSTTSNNNNNNDINSNNNNNNNDDDDINLDEKKQVKSSLLKPTSKSGSDEDDDDEDNHNGIEMKSLKPVSIDDSITIRESSERNKTDAEKLMMEPEEPPAISRQQWIRILVIYSAVLSDGLSLTLVQPFLPSLLKEKWGFEESEVGWASGLLIGCYSLARFFSSFYLGHMSDRFGRKPFLVLSLVSTGIGTAIFSFMPNLVLAMIVRFLEGIFSNTTALCQATLADMVDKRNRPAIFAYLGAIFALSRCLSSTLGGIVVKLAENTENPYVYPCVLGGAIVLTSSVLVFILHPETHPRFAKPGINANQEDFNKQGGKQYTLKEGLKLLAQDHSLVLLFIIGSINSYNNGGLLLSIVLYASLPTDKHGLGMDPSENGIIFSVLGLFGFLFQITFFKKLSRKIGLKKQYLLGSMLLAVGMAIFPLTFMGYIVQGKAMVWVLLMIIVPINSIGFMQCLPIVQGMIANASRTELQGLTQGTAQSLNSLLRSFGPTISGALFSLSLSFPSPSPWLLFSILSIVYVALAITSLHLPDSVDVLRTGKKSVSKA
ncbi:hypothetical protein DFA_09814 [Cavenderia fasciculata]|uniref:Major facilitator superfamily (MFS) profile domain-containing protein n=1 Tax=Cavenderia fasciculata TaxID=261658 RepID=F4QAT5_CACFS|nr:uncharacterized protein DFA_09814 [Cavenderia fasciculata]EGG14994.1 hypothetical protein DFA_09814 [Cavenderia fasciculata]|eukprot:XP_004351714.1 hypothetical protein DFA_09814 [Cavenderia fasciculata]